jgi:hypothetical protein
MALPMGTSTSQCDSRFAGLKTASKDKINSSLGMVAELKSILAILVGDSNGFVVQLMYEILALTIGGLKYSETRYLEELMAMMLQQKDFQYEFVKFGT